MLPTQHLKTAIALVLSLSALIAPAANAASLRGDPPCSGCVFSAAGHPASGSSVGGSPVIVRVAPKSGFAWADAGIGAAAVLAVALVVLGLTVVVRSSRPAPAGKPSTGTLGGRR